ncbi:uncharacterized protein BDR25DRAFT_359428 [Lindgomyces ingoldianus]|uniref:Uncharacterized protein n=1 Tax=Lindgomyces ingoldianus TaxID=673940 RepID=A0ACB6QK70_9PLEO|nr:uncharacterized protein BDR25DRAFT_359428 [Lindgomyces ingoldianus]KAF2466536.1 hypothetical protein BDR25DRAFT_359428 [Lindgomyces ingoldianus]
MVTSTGSHLTMTTNSITIRGFGNTLGMLLEFTVMQLPFEWAILLDILLLWSDFVMFSALRGLDFGDVTIEQDLKEKLRSDVNTQKHKILHSQ